MRKDLIFFDIEMFQELKEAVKKENDKTLYSPAAISELEKITMVKNSKNIYIRRYGLISKQKKIFSQFGMLLLKSKFKELLEDKFK